MNSDRIKEIQEETAYPESGSVQQALLKVWHDTRYDTRQEMKANIIRAISKAKSLKDGDDWVSFTEVRELVKTA